MRESLIILLEFLIAILISEVVLDSEISEVQLAKNKMTIIIPRIDFIAIIFLTYFFNVFE